MQSRLILALGLSLAALTPQIVSAETVWLDGLNLAAATQDYGEPHKNQSLTGKPLTIGGKIFARGFGTHAEGKLHVNLAGGAEKFSASASNRACAKSSQNIRAATWRSSATAASSA